MATYTRSNLESQGIMDVLDVATDPECVLVAEDHPLIAALEGKTEGGPIRYDRWIRLERSLVQTCCNTLARDGFGTRIAP
jgi:hypothetical protein